MLLALIIAMPPLLLAAECATISSALPSRRPRLPGERQSGFMKCQCKLFCEIDGEQVRTCDGFNIKLAQRSVSFGGFQETAIRSMLVSLGYDTRLVEHCNEADLIASALANNKPGASSNYRFSVYHFAPEFLRWTNKMVKWSTEKRSFWSIWPNIPADLVYHRTRLFAAAYVNDPDGTSTEPFARAVLPPPLARAPPAERALRASARDLAAVRRRVVSTQLGGKRLSRTPSSAQRPGKTARAQSERARELDALQRLGGALAESFEAVAGAETERDAAARHAAEADSLRLAAQAAAAARAADHAAELAAATAARDQLARQLEVRERQLLEQTRMLEAERVAHEHLKAAAKRSELMPSRWCTAMLAPGGALTKLCAPLTTFTSLDNFQLWYDVVCDKQGWKDPSLAGTAGRLDYYYAPKHAPQLEIGAPEPAPLDAAAARAVADARWRQQLNPAKPGGLASPFEACFMTMTQMRLGLSVAEVSVLFGISTGSVSQIFHTWLPYLHESMKAWTPWPGRELVRANLPKKFTTHLAQVTHSKDCHLIFDCTEVKPRRPRASASQTARNPSLDPASRAAQIEVDIPEDEYLRKLFYSSYKKYHTLKYLVAITPCGRLAFVSDGYPGSFSDDEIVRASGFLDLLEPGMAVMSDRGYDNFPALRQRGVELIIPSLSHTMGKGAGRERAPFTEAECVRTYRIANVRIHVERVRLR